PFADGAFDHVHASAVIEHVGSRAMQARFLAEAWRVARKGIFLTTPNRWFPVEFHAVVPLLHWLPAAAFRAALRAWGDDFLADEANLNLLSAGDLARLAAGAGIAAARVDGVALLGWPSNLILHARRP
ncbi:MAG: methyltransferase domain-containing protein, partial [Stellaceae bacterium]